MKLREYLQQQRTSTLLRLRDWLNAEIEARDKLEQIDLSQTLDGIIVKDILQSNRTVKK